MAEKREIEVAAKIEITPEILARMFWELDDEDQAAVLNAIPRVAAEAVEENRRQGGHWGDPSMQWFAVGSHLATCDCVSDEARAFVADVFEGMVNPLPRDVEEAQRRAQRQGKFWNRPYVYVPERR